ncbi:MAG: AAA-like domain-containing protein [Candidatus Omnitrophota bacterium]
MERFFNTAGPIERDDHYYIDPLDRINLDEILRLIDQKKYFVLHAPRQTGKTTYMHALMDYLNTQGKYKCLYVNIESAQAARENVEKGMREILNSFAKAASFYLNDSFFEDKGEQILNKKRELGALIEALSQWSADNKKPIVLFIDEIDSLVGDTLISVLRQLRSGYPMRPGSFPQSIVLCGIRDVRDYRIYSDKEKTVITGGSAFNVKAESLRLGNFNPEEIRQLYLQHTAETGQQFNDDVFPLVWNLTEGQPWLVNALAYETCFRMEEGRNRKTEITADMIEQAKENLILRRETHLDQLTDKLKEDRIKRVLTPLLVGSEEIEKIPDDDIEYAVDLGLVKRKPQLAIANRIYQEIIPRQLTSSAQTIIVQEAAWYMAADGRLNMDKLLTAFQEFFRKNFEHWVDGLDYAEAGPQLLLQAFLQRIINGGGRVEREYGLGRQRTDLFISWPYKGGIQNMVIELKLKYGSMEKTIEKGLEQTWEYMDKCGTSEGYLLVVNRAKKTSWKEKIFKKEKTFKETKIFVYGM